jgi:hypothetical protein
MQQSMVKKVDGGEELSRRDFLRVTAIGAGSVAAGLLVEGTALADPPLSDAIAISSPNAGLTVSVPFSAYGTVAGAWTVISAAVRDKSGMLISSGQVYQKGLNWQANFNSGGVVGGYVLRVVAIKASGGAAKAELTLRNFS